MVWCMIVYIDSKILIQLRVPGGKVDRAIVLCNDVKVKRYPMALSLVKLHKQPKGLGERP